MYLCMLTLFCKKEKNKILLPDLETSAKADLSLQDVSTNHPLSGREDQSFEIQ